MFTGISAGLRRKTTLAALAMAVLAATVDRHVEGEHGGGRPGPGEERHDPDRLALLGRAEQGADRQAREKGRRNGSSTSMSIP